MNPGVIYTLPTLLTLGNLLCGLLLLLSLLGANERPVSDMAWLVYLAMLFDGSDGAAARWLNATSRFGQMLDCVADVVSFGVAPAVLCWQVLSSAGMSGTAIAGWFVCATALRLARFAAEEPSTHPHGFIGLPCPAAAGVVAGAVIADLPGWILAGATAGLGCLMVSSLRYPHPSRWLVPQSSFQAAALGAAGIAGLLALGGYAPLAICVLFVLAPFAERCGGLWASDASHRG